MAFKVYAKDCSITADTPHAAAVSFFDTFPSKRKCNIIEGAVDGVFFTVTFGLAREGKWPRSYKGVTRKTLINLEVTQ